MMIKIEREPCTVIKYYKVRVVTYTTYDVFLIHNETTGRIEMTSDGMSGASYDECIEDVLRIFKEQMALNNDGKMHEENLCCLVDKGNLHVTLDLSQLGEIRNKPEIDFINQTWKSHSKGLCKIGEDSGGIDEIRFIFNVSNFEHLKKAFELAQNFQR